MSEQDKRDRLEQRLRQDAAGLRYPPTPNFAGQVEQGAKTAWPLRWAVGVALILIASLAVQPVRAALFDFLQVGGVAIEVPEEDTSTSLVSQLTVYALKDLTNPTSLMAVRTEANFPIRLPAWPLDAGVPDAVYLQTVTGENQFAILVWLDSPQGEIDFALYILGPGVAITKGAPLTLEELQVNGHQAAYVQGGHLLVVQGFHESGVLVAGPALIWEGGDGLTYRLESNRPLAELVRIAESIEFSE